MAVCRVESVVLEGQLIDVAHVERHVVVTTGFRGCTGQFNLRFLHVNAVEFSRRDGIGEADRDVARPAAEIQQLHPGPQMWQQVESVAAGAAAIEELPEFLCVSHGVLRIGRGVLRHFQNSLGVS